MAGSLAGPQTHQTRLEANGIFPAVPSPFFPGILLSRKPPETQGKRILLLKRTMVEKNGESTPRIFGAGEIHCRGLQLKAFKRPCR